MPARPVQGSYAFIWRLWTGASLRHEAVAEHEADRGRGVAVDPHLQDVDLAAEPRIIAHDVDRQDHPAKPYSCPAGPWRQHCRWRGPECRDAEKRCRRTTARPWRPSGSQPLGRILAANDTAIIAKRRRMRKPTDPPAARPALRVQAFGHGCFSVRPARVQGLHGMSRPDRRVIDAFGRQPGAGRQRRAVRRVRQGERPKCETRQSQHRSPSILDRHAAPAPGLTRHYQL